MPTDEKNPPATSKTLKVWRTLETTGLIALTGLVGCSIADNNFAGKESLTNDQAREQLPLAAGEGAGEGALDANLTSADDIAYLTQLGLMRGHLWVGLQLQRSALNSMAVSHMKHPKAELYSSLTPAFAARDVDGFASQLATLADAVENKAPLAQIETHYKTLATAITQSEQGADIASAKVIGEVIVALLRTAAEEYAVGVVDGKINNLHEYQDAFGFTHIAGLWARSPAFAKPAQATAVAARIQGILSELDDLWPSLNPQELGTGQQGDYKAAQLYGAAARIEIEVLGL